MKRDLYPTRINVGCGRDYRLEWENWDISNDVRAERHFDIRIQPWPREDESAEEVYISGVLEQIGDNAQFIHVMNEMHRVLQPGGVATIVVPNARYAIAHRDPMDVRKFTPETFAYFDAASKEYDLYGSVYGFKPWSRIRIEENRRHILTVCLTK